MSTEVAPSMTAQEYPKALEKPGDEGLCRNFRRAFSNRGAAKFRASLTSLSPPNARYGFPYARNKARNRIAVEGRWASRACKQANDKDSKADVGRICGGESLS